MCLRCWLPNIDTYIFSGKPHLALKLLFVRYLRHEEFGFAVEASGNDAIVEGFLLGAAIRLRFDDPTAVFRRNALHLCPCLYGIPQLEMIHIILDVLLGLWTGGILAPRQVEGEIQEFIELFWHLNSKIHIVLSPNSTDTGILLKNLHIETLGPQGSDGLQTSHTSS